MKIVLAVILRNCQLVQKSWDRSIQPLRRGITFVPDLSFRLQRV